jgi:predicted MFS family arabinose efflux permease
MTPERPAGAPAGARPSGLLLLATAYFASSAQMRVCDPMLPALAQTFGTTTGQAALTISLYAVAYGLMQLVFGPLGDRFGKRRVIGFAALACVAGNLAALVALSLDMLVAARVLAGAAAAGIIPLVLAWIGDTVPYERRQAVLARFLSASILGMIAGQWVSGLLIDLVGWRSVFVVLAVLFGVAGTGLSLNRQVRAEPRRRAGEQGHVRQILDVLGRPWARWVLATVALEGAFAFSVMAFLPAFLVAEFGIGISWAAGVVALYGVGGMVYSFAAKRLVTSLGEPGQCLAGGWLLAFAWAPMAFATHWVAALPACVLAGLGYYMLHNTLTTHATQMAPEVRGTAVGLYASALFVGIAAGVAVTALAVDGLGFRPVFFVCGAGLAVIGMVFAASLRRRAARMPTAEAV